MTTDIPCKSDTYRVRPHPWRPRTRPRRALLALSVPNYRIYLGGQAVSLVGTWMQAVALGWLVLQLGASGTVLGLITAAQFAPVLLLGAYGGLLADRADKRRLLVYTQLTSGLLAAGLAVLDLTGVVQLWMVALVAAGLGAVNAVDNPTRQSFVHEMVGADVLANAISLNSVVVNAARAVGPGVAGVLIAVAGTGVCFMVNAVSFLAVIVSLTRMDPRALRRRDPLPRARGQVREGFGYVLRTPALRVPLAMMAVIGTLAYEFQVVLPLLGRVVFHGGAGTYGLLTGAMGVGAVIGGLFVARRSRASLRTLVVSAAGFGAVILLASSAPEVHLAAAAMVLVGAGSVAFLSAGNAALQLASEPHMRGRVMALWTVAFLGSTPVGGPTIGWISEQLGARAGLATGGLAALAAAWYGARHLSDRPVSRSAPTAAPPRQPPCQVRVAATVRSDDPGVPGPH
ncbi:MFS transporter [Frankia sp. Cppng1_Ct_nod]|uniref:MFS transporter n=1 Tax=Frankia sp. Cppng1_Ct_nod TaxID=2897162 RepID=UPI001041B284|nr:MFS transporter [Frankia sp. Cppng1_Ct_nod]